MPTQGDAHRQPRQIGCAYQLEQRDGQTVRVYAQRLPRRSARGPQGHYNISVFPSSGGKVIAQATRPTEAEARIAVGLS